MSATSSAGSLPRRHVLVVDDEPDARRMVGRHLSGAGFAVLEAADIAEAIAHVDARADDIAVAIVDVMLPGGPSGLELIRELERRAASGHRRLPVVALTARRSLEDTYAGLDAGADFYVPKPFHAAELLDVVVMLARRR